MDRQNFPFINLEKWLLMSLENKAQGIDFPYHFYLSKLKLCDKICNKLLVYVCVCVCVCVGEKNPNSMLTETIIPSPLHPYQVHTGAL